MAPVWRYMLFDAVSHEPQCEVEALAGSGYSEVLNAPGSAKLVMPLVPGNAAAVTPEMVKPPRAIVAFEKDNVLMWAGPVITREYDLKADTLTLNCEGWWNYVRRRLVQTPGFTYSATDQISIATGLITWMQSWTDGDLLINTSGAALSGVLRDRTYPYYEHASIGTLIEQLAAVENGFDFRLYPRWYGGIANTAMELRMEFSYPATGRNTGIAFDVDANADAERVTDDWSAFATSVTAMGQGTGVTQLTSIMNNNNLMHATLRLEAIESRTDVSISATLTEHANRRLKRGAQGIQDVSVTFDTSYLGELRMGDRVRVRADRGLLQLDNEYRIVAWDVDIEGDVVRPKLAPIEAWTASII